MGGKGSRTPIVFTTSWQQYCLARNGPDNISQPSELRSVEPAEELPFHNFDADEEEEDGSEASEYEHSFHDFAADEQSEEESDVDVTIIIIRKTTSRQ